MVQSNKVLTVSYGTFSCTLEGFEDSFDTMKAIAEYFRDLAADDRYFGAEPPTPDAEMLAKIAEREVARRVEAHMDESGILLRAAPAAAVATGVAAPALVEPDHSQDDVASPADTAAEDRIAPPVEAVVAEEPEEIAAPDTTDNVLDDTISHAGVDMRALEDVLAPDAPLEEAQAPDEDVVALQGAEDSTPEVTEDFVTSLRDLGVDGHYAAEIADLAPVAQPPKPSDDSIADKLARIRAVVAGGEADTASDYSEDEHAPETVDPYNVSAALADDVEEPAEAEVAKEDPELEPAPSARATAAQAPDTDERPRGPVRVVRVKRGVRKAVDAAGPAAAAPLVLQANERVADAVHSSLSPEDEDDLMRELAEVEAELSGDDALYDKAADVAPEEDLEDAAADADRASYLDDDDEDDEEDYLAKYAEPRYQDMGSEDDDADESDIAPKQISDNDRAAVSAAVARAMSPESFDDEEDKETAIVPAEPAPNSEPADPGLYKSIRSLTRRVRLSEGATATQDQDVSRLMAETDAQMEEPESRNRRSAIAHLRAAVAATRDERNSGVIRPQSQTREAQFREDLDAVRPRTEDGDAKRAAPLKLVAEQRVDAAQKDLTKPASQPSQAEVRAASSIQNVRPRRVARRAADVEQGGNAGEPGGFMSYAEDIGARELPELLEAAAAYMTLVEKRPQFSRPQLMSKVREAGEEDYSREDRLRYFGQLLREGKIEKTASGRFTASDAIGFRPDTRAVG